MIGFNGGRIGSKNIASIVASGIWLPNEQSIAKRIGEWPVGPSEFGIRVGTQEPNLGNAEAITTTGWTQIISTSADEQDIETANFGFTFTLAGQQFTTCYVSSNGYLAFGGPGNAYNVSASVPAFPKIFYTPGDRRVFRVFTKVGSSYGVSYFAIRWEGSDDYENITSSDTFVEIYLTAESLTKQFVEIRYGDTVANYSIGIFSSNIQYAGSVSTQRSSWVFAGNATGTSWTLESNRFVIA